MNWFVGAMNSNALFQSRTLWEGLAGALWFVVPLMRSVIAVSDPRPGFLSRLPLTDTMSFTPTCNSFVAVRTGTRVAVITSAMGDFERSTKPYATQTIPVDYYCFTNHRGLINRAGWRLIFTPYDSMNVSDVDQGQWVNSRSKNDHPYMVYKFYKMQFHRIPILSRYDLIVWIDMTILVTSPTAIEGIWSLFEEFPTRQIFACVHPDESRHGMITAEMEASVQDGRWTSTELRGHDQPFQNVRGQHDFYVRQGYSQAYWGKEDLRYFAGQCTGLWQTDIMAFRMTDPLTRPFLDAWYTELLNWSTQCQVSFSYVLQQFKIYPISSPTKTYSHWSHFRKVDHGS